MDPPENSQAPPPRILRPHFENSYFEIIKKNGLWCMQQWMRHTDIMLNKRSLAQKAAYCIIYFIQLSRTG